MDLNRDLIRKYGGVKEEKNKKPSEFQMIEEVEMSELLEGSFMDAQEEHQVIPAVSQKGSCHLSLRKAKVTNS